MLVVLTATCLLSDKINVRVDGEGYMRFLKNNDVVFATTAALTVKNGVLVNQDGLQTLPKIGAGDGADLQVELDGSVIVSGRFAGRLVLSNFADDATLKKSGQYFVTTSKTLIGNPGEGIFGVIRTDITSSQKPSTTKTSNLHLGFRFLTEVNSLSISLGDVAEVQADLKTKSIVEKIDLGTAPMLGGERLLSLSYIISKMRSVGVDPDKWQIDFPEGSKVIRRSNKLETQSMVDAAIGILQSEFEVNVPLRCTRLPSILNLPLGKVEMKGSVLKRDDKSVEVSLDILVEGKVFANRLIPFSPETVQAPVPVAKPQVPISTEGVKAGDTVVVRLLRNGGAVEMTGRAMGSAPIGQSVSVTTESSGSTRSITITGRVKAVGVVEVQL